VPRSRILINALSVTEGGGRSYIRNLLRELGGDSRGFDFTALAASGQLSVDEAVGLDTITVRLPPPPRAARTLLRVAYEELWLPARAVRFDLLYCIADLAPALAWTPTVVALRNLNIYDRRFFNDVRVRSLERLVRLGLPRSRRVVFPSRAAADLVRQRIPIDEERIRIVPHGVSRSGFEPESSSASDRGARYLFLPAAVEPHKNVGVLIESLTLLEDSDLQVWIAGNTESCPEYAAKMRALVEERGLGARVRFLGHVSYGDILRYHEGAVALVFPSMLESFGHPLLEAMLAETPIIASDIPALREVAGDAALYFPAHDPASLARVIERVIGDEAATRARIQAGRARAEEFSWKRSVDLLCGIFDEVLRGG
jgi:glycosyltransferase involved in cell wall biosynthesis